MKGKCSDTRPTVEAKMREPVIAPAKSFFRIGKAPKIKIFPDPSFQGKGEL
jgi:hypothetical protein